MNLDKPIYKVVFNIAFLLVFTALAILHSRKIIPLDSISLALIIIAIIPVSLSYINRKLLPYMSKNFRAIEIFGIKAELLAKLEKQDEKWACIRLRISEIPPIMLSDRENLRINPTDL